MKNYYKKIISMLVIAVVGAPMLVLAQNKGFTVANPLGVTTVTELLKKIGGYFYGFLTFFVTLIIFYGAFQILTAGSDSAKVKAGKDTIFYAIVGLVAVFFAYGLQSLITGILGGQGGGN